MAALVIRFTVDGPMATFADLDMPASSALTQKWLGWKPKEIGLIEDTGQPGYFAPWLNGGGAATS
jgi:phage repressor protein C with HTH and peptisase S24 domain